MLDIPNNRAASLQPPKLLRDINLSKWLYGYQELLENPALQQVVVGEHFMDNWKWILVRKRPDDIEPAVLATGQGYYNRVPALDNGYNFFHKYI